MKILILIIVVVFIVSMKSIKKALINFELSRFIGKNENEIKKIWGNPNLYPLSRTNKKRLG